LSEAPSRQTVTSIQTVTSLRTRYERACAKDLAAQTRECIEYLQNPEILMAEFSDSFLMAQTMDTREQDFRCAELPIPTRRRRTDHAVRRLVAAPALSVPGPTPYRFKYVARDIVPLWTAPQDESEDVMESRRFKGLDYVAITQEPFPVPVLGVVVPPDTPAPYLSLLRVLTCLAEVSTEAQMERANRFLFRGILSCPTAFDIHLLRVCPDTPCEPTALGQLTRDLAEVFHLRVQEEWQVPDVLRHALCLEMPSPKKDFDGKLRLLWQV